MVCLHFEYLGGVECPNGGFRPCEGPGLARISGLLVDSLIILASRVLYISATIVISCLDSNRSASILRPIWVVWSAQMAVSGLVKDLWQESVFTGGQPYNIGSRVLCRFCYISATKEPAQPCNLVSGLQSWSASILRPIWAQMAVSGLVKDLAWQESVVYWWTHNIGQPCSL